MLTHSEALWLQITTAIVALVGPIIAVVITILYQNRAAKQEAKMQIFMDLVSFRHHNPAPWQFVVALNRIDVVFHKEEEVCRLWHKYYDLTRLESSPSVSEQMAETRTELISAIAKSLGYKNIDQIYLNRYYQTVGSYEDYLGDVQLKQAAMGYFQTGNEMNKRVIDRMGGDDNANPL